MRIVVERLFRITRAALLCLSFLVIAGAELCAQVGTPGTFVGTVRDASGGAIVGAKVTASNLATGAATVVVTNENGLYRIPELPPGHYRIEATMTGFTTQLHDDLELTVSQTQELNFTLAVGSTTETVTVTSEAPLVDTSSSTVSSLVDEKQIQNLPLNGHSFDQLITLTPGVASSSAAFSASGGRGLNAQFEIGGTRPDATRLTVDGAEMAGGGSLSSLVGTASGKLLGVDSLAEFAIVSNDGGAIAGKLEGGQINIVTRSGSNAFHGSVYDYVRSNIFDADNYFATSTPHLLRNNYGGSLGGPIVKNKTFFFFNAEQYKDREDTTLVAAVPTLAVRQGIVPTGLIANGVCTNTVVTPNPDGAAILNLYPTPNGAVLLGTNGCSTGTQFANQEKPASTDDNFYLGRIDQQISQKQSLFGRYMIQTGHRLVPNDNGLGLFPESDPFRVQLFTLGHKYVISNALLNQFTLSFNRGYGATVFTFAPGVVVPPQMFLIPGRSGPNQEGAVSVGGTGATAIVPVLGGQGTASTGGRFNARQVYEIDDQLSYTRGQHFLQWGIQGQKIMANENDASGNNGTVLFPTLLALVQGKPSQATGPLAGSNGMRSYRQFYVGTYLQDNYRINSKLTLNMGLRWEFLSNPTESHGLMFVWGPDANGIFPNAPTVTTHPFLINHSGNFAPRLGFAWNVFGSGRTSIRGGFGMFYNQLQNDYRRTGGAGAPFFSILTVTNPPWPTPGTALSNAAAGKLAVLSQDPNANIPTVLQYNLTVEQQVASSVVFSVGYVGNHGYHQVRNVDPQIPAPFVNAAGALQIPSQTPLNPNLSGAGSYYAYDVNSSYNSLQATVEKRLSRGLQIKAAFAWSKALDEGTAPFGGTIGIASNASVLSIPGYDKGPAAFDVERTFTLNWLYDLPFGTHKNVIGALLNSWQFSGIYHQQSGLPFSLFDGVAESFATNNASTSFDRANINPAFSGPIILGGPNRYFNPEAFIPQPAGVLGNTASGFLTGPGLSDVDVALMKSFQLSEKFRIQFRAEAFNVLNHPNFALPGNSLFNSITNANPVTGATPCTSTATVTCTVRSFVRNSNAGVITSTATDNREMQFTLKLIF